MLFDFGLLDKPKPVLVRYFGGQAASVTLQEACLSVTCSVLSEPGIPVVVTSQRKLNRFRGTLTRTIRIRWE